jgi:hypothetical protein
MGNNGFPVRNSLLNQHDSVVSNVLLEIHVRAGNNQVIGPIPSPVVEGEALILKITQTASRQFVPRDREFDQPESSKNFVKALNVVG